jgi:hypothetical protein
MGDEAYGRSKFAEAGKLFADLVFAETFPDFLTLPAYDRIAG